MLKVKEDFGDYLGAKRLTMTNDDWPLKTEMRKIIAAINLTLDGFWGHTVLLPDEEIQQHYTD